MSNALLIVGEGHGEILSLARLVARTGNSLGLVPYPFNNIPEPMRMVVTDEASAVKAALIARRNGAAAALITADSEDTCPAKHAPRLAAAIRAADVGIPCAVVLFYREFETLAISIAPELDGKILRDGSGEAILSMNLQGTLPTDAESPRGAKEWLSRHLLGGVTYKPTVHQLPLVKVMDIDALRAADLSSFRRLETALTFLAKQVLEAERGIYPDGVTA